MLTNSRVLQRAQRQTKQEHPAASVLLTPEGIERLKNELYYLRCVRLPKAIDWVRDVASEGFDDDVTEYERANTELEYLQRRIREIDDQLASAEVLTDPLGAKTAQIGSRVTVSDGQSIQTYRIVGPAEANPSQGLISDRSPLGKAVLGRAPGDQIVIETPDGTAEYHIVGIS